MTRLVQVDMTKTMLVRLPAEEAEDVLHKDACSTDLAERVTRWLRIAHHDPQQVDGYLTVSDASEVRLDDWAIPEPVDGVDGKPSYLWSARHFVGRARYELSCGRYREGHCPDLDEVNRLLGRLEEELRLMAFAADPKTAAIAESERAAAQARAAKQAPEKVVVFS